MLDIQEARNQFLGHFPLQYREHIIEFSKTISKIKVDIILLTARKSVCLFHCLEYLKLFEPGKKLVISERWVDHNTDWAKGKSIAIVDEVIVTGTSIYKIHNKLEKSGAKSIDVYCLFINTRYFVEDFFSDISLIRSFICLDGGEAQSLSTSIVEAMHTIPRPYSVDYPMSTWMHIAGNQLDRIFTLPNWTTIELPGGKNLKSETKNRTIFLSTTPNKRLFPEIDTFLGANLSSNALLKIRLYGISSSTNDTERHDFRIVPFVVIDEISEETLNEIFTKLTTKLSDKNRLEIINSCTSLESKLRLANYIFALRLANYWANIIAESSIKISFRQDSRELAYVFPETIHSAINEASILTAQNIKISYIATQKSKPLHSKIINLNNANYALPVFNQLAEPFFKMFKEKELKLRGIALEYGRKIFSTGKYKEIINRLDEGISFQELKNCLINKSEKQVNQITSTFVDISVDSGVIVPITMSRIENGTRILCRAYRHGEETYILARDLALFHTMLESFIKEWNSENTNQQPATVPKLLVEKLLILFLRYSLGRDLLKPNYDRLDQQAERFIKINVGYHKQGARLAIGEHEVTHFKSEQAFINLLKRENIVKKSTDNGYEISHSKLQTPLDKQRLAGSKLFGSVMGKILSHIPNEISNDKNINNQSKPKPKSKIRDELVIALTTCESAQSTLSAVAAELRLFSEFHCIGFSPDSPENLLKKIQSYQSKTYLHSAQLKVKLHLNRHATNIAEKIEKFFEEDQQTQSNWIDIWQASLAHRSSDIEREANQELKRCFEVVLKADLGLMELRYTLNSMLPRTSNRPLLKSLSQDITNAVSSLKREAEGLGNRDKNLKANSAFSRAILNVVKEFEPGFLITVSTPPNEALKIACNKMNSVLADAERMYRSVDIRFKELGSAPTVYQYNQVLKIEISEIEKIKFFDSEKWKELLAEIDKHVCRANTGSPPRNYNQANTDGDVQLIEIRYKQDLGNLASINFYGRGNGAPRWFGYLVARFSSITDDISDKISFRWGALFELDETRTFSRCRNSTEIIGNFLVEHELDQELNKIDWFDGILISSNYDTENKSLNKFHMEYSSIRKNLTNKRVPLYVDRSDALGGQITKAAYQSPNNAITFKMKKPQNNTKILLVTVTSNERKSVLKTLHSLNIECNEQFDSEFKGHKFLYPTDSENPILVQIIRLEDQGPTEAGIRIAEEKSKLQPDAIIMVGMCMGIKGRIESNSVIVPKEIFSVAHVRETPQGQKFIPHPFRANKTSHERLSSILDSAESNFPFKVVQKQIGTGPRKEEDPDGDIYDYLTSTSTDIVGYEMEAEGLYRALEQHKIEALLIKGVADFGDFSENEILSAAEIQKRKEIAQYQPVHNSLLVALDWIQHFHNNPV